MLSIGLANKHDLHEHESWGFYIALYHIITTTTNNNDSSNNLPRDLRAQELRRQGAQAEQIFIVCLVYVIVCLCMWLTLSALS